METKKAIFRNSKERIPSLVLSCEHELICLVYERQKAIKLSPVQNILL